MTWRIISAAVLSDAGVYCCLLSAAALTQPPSSPQRQQRQQARLSKNERKIQSIVALFNGALMHSPAEEGLNTGQT